LKGIWEINVFEMPSTGYRCNIAQHFFPSSYCRLWILSVNYHYLPPIRVPETFLWEFWSRSQGHHSAALHGSHLTSWDGWPPALPELLFWTINILEGPFLWLLPGCDGLSGDWGGSMEVGPTAQGLAAELALEGWIWGLARSQCSQLWKLLLCLPGFPFLGPSELSQLLSGPAWLWCAIWSWVFILTSVIENIPAYLSTGKWKRHFVWSFVWKAKLVSHDLISHYTPLPFQ
jgi:hypothetical protein